MNSLLVAAEFALAMVLLTESGLLYTQLRRGPKREPSVVRHLDATLSRVRRARVTFSRMSEALAVQMKGFGAWL